MNSKRYQRVLLKCFNALDKRKRARLRWHAKQKTPICCQWDAYRFVMDDNAG